MDNTPISCSGHPILRTNLVTSIKVQNLLQVSEFRMSVKVFIQQGNLHICHLQRKWIHSRKLSAIYWGCAHTLSDLKAQEVTSLSLFYDNFWLLDTGLVLETPTSRQDWRTMTGAWTKTGQGFGTPNMESWLRFGLKLGRKEFLSLTLTGGEVGEVQVWGLSQKRSRLASSTNF